MNIATTVQPRLGVALQLDPKTVLRAGSGEFATRMGLLDNIFPGGNPPFQPFVTVAAVAGNFTSMVDNPGVALNPTGAPPLTVTSLVKNLNAPIRWNWNVSIQRELPLNSTFTLAYVGGRGYHNWRVFDINQPIAGALQANPGKNVNALRPYLGFAAIQQEQSNGCQAITQCKFHGTATAPIASCSASATHGRRAWTTVRTIATSFPTRTTPLTSRGRRSTTLAIWWS